jgi:three-Cys-motif partner protein
MRQDNLFVMPEASPVEPKVKQVQHPVWSDNKAALIERYLRLFVYVTKHGTYIDGFAGPQAPDKTDAWSAKLVIESQPRWFRNFFLFDKSPAQVQRLHELVDAQPPPDRSRYESKRNFKIFRGDFNEAVVELLDSKAIKDEAVFCLLDQRTFECRWSTVESLARYKTTGTKIETFYFLANGWLDRALHNKKDEEELHHWWGREGWHELRRVQPQVRAYMFCERIKKELGYRSVKPWPIFERKSGGRIMYYMIHATDHKDAPQLMARAYRGLRAASGIPEQEILLNVAPSVKPKNPVGT